MAPNLRFSKIAEEDEELKFQREQIKSINNIKEYDYKLEIVWRNVMLMGALHLSAVYGMWVSLWWFRL